MMMMMMMMVIIFLISLQRRPLPQLQPLLQTERVTHRQHLHQSLTFKYHSNHSQRKISLYIHSTEQKCQSSKVTTQLRGNWSKSYGGFTVYKFFF